MFVTQLIEIPDEAGHVTICSVFPFNAGSGARPGLPYIKINRKLPEQRYALTLIADARVPTHKGDLDGTFELRFYPAKQIADDIIESGGIAKLGIFVCTGDGPTEAELVQAEATLQDYWKEMLAEGDAIWSQFRKQKFVSNHSVMAARVMRQVREWAADPRATVACPNCEEGVTAAAAICPKCSCVLNWTLAAERGMLSDKLIEMGQASGKLPPKAKRVRDHKGHFKKPEKEPAAA
jgi:hypothetical protein